MTAIAPPLPATGPACPAFVEAARRLPPMPMAIVHPCDPHSLVAAVEARAAGLIEPILVGPPAKIEAAAKAAGVALDGLSIEPVPHSHAAAERAVEMARTGRVMALAKGSLHTDELMHAVLSSAVGIRTDRVVSHAYVLDVESYGKTLVVTDAAINIAPGLAEKRDICRNAIDLLRLLGHPMPRVAVLSAVETVTPKIVSTVDAAALTVMARRGQIEGGLVDGPLAFDNAISPEAARTKGLVSEVAGMADILLVPDLESGNMLAKQLIHFGKAGAAGIVLGAKVPVMLTSRADSVAVRLASAALARLVVHFGRQAAP